MIARRTIPVLLGLMASPLFAQTAGMLSFQGLIKDNVGNPINGSVNLEFRIYDAETLGNLVDMDGDGLVENVIGQDVKQVLGVSVTNGILSTKFGPIHPSSFDGSLRWLEVSIGGSPLSRVEMATAPGAAEQVNQPGSVVPALRIESNAISPNLIGGFSGNSVALNTVGVTIAGGGAASFENRVYDEYATVGGGMSNQAGSDDANPTTGRWATVGGGESNTASSPLSTVSGGGSNTADGNRSTIGGGESNTAGGNRSTVGGGQSNTASGLRSTVAGGESNTASGDSSTVPGGHLNVAGGDFSFAAGRRAKVTHAGAFVWGDSTDADVASTAVDQFIIRASGGVGIGTTSPTEQLTVAGMIGSTTGGFKLPDGTILNDASDLGSASTLDAAYNSGGPGAGRTITADAGAVSITGPGGLTVASTIESTTGGFKLPDGTILNDASDLGSASTLDAAYDSGGAGAGRIITADAGAVSIAGSDGLTVAGTIESTSGGFKLPDGTILGDASDLGSASTLDAAYDSGGAGAGRIITADAGAVSIAGPGGLTVAGTIQSGGSIIIDGTSDTITSTGDLELHVSSGRILRLEPNATSPSIIGGHPDNTVAVGAIGATIAGGGGAIGDENRVFGEYGTVSGGIGNQAGSDGGNPLAGRWATVGGGRGNAASGLRSTVGGGSGNIASGNSSSVSGGQSNTASAGASTVGGGSSNTASGVDLATVAGGGENTASGSASTISGGALNTANGNSSTVSGGINNTASGLESAVGGGRDNIASGDWSTIGGGQNNFAGADHSTVGGGRDNTANATWSTIGGGVQNTANGPYSTVPGGLRNIAGGWHSFAAGVGAKADNDGMFVWSDSSRFLFFFPSATESNFTPAPDQFLARATGGVVFVSAIDGGGNSTAGVQLAAGGGSWSALSSRDAKANVDEVDGREILERLRDVPIATWNYKSQDESIRHIGPMAQDFSAAFGVGEKETMITTIDADGVALAAIQGLYDIVTEKGCEIGELEAQNQAQQEVITDLQSRLTRIEAWMVGLNAASHGGVR